MTRKMIEEYYDVDQTDQEQDITDEQDHVLYDATTNTLHPPVLINNHLGGILGVNATKRQQLLNQLLSINNT